MAPEVGMQVFARGQLTVWAKQPRIQFRVSAMEDQGECIWRRAFERTRAALEQDGAAEENFRRFDYLAFGGEDGGVGAEGAGGVGGFFELGAVAGDEGEACAFTGECEGDGFAESFAGAGDEGGAVGEGGHGRTGLRG